MARPRNRKPANRAAAQGAPVAPASAADGTRAGETGPGGTGPAGADGGNPARAPDRRAAALIGVLTLLLGFAIAVQLHSTSTHDALAGARQDDLVAILDDQDSQAVRLRARIADLQTVLARLQQSGSGAAAALQEAQRQADALAILTGTAAATGPGITLTISDPDAALRAEDLLDVVEELRGAGAEAIQFGPVRVGLSSSFTDAGGGSGGGGKVSLDGVALSAPYTVLAIGPAATMDTAMNIPGGVAATARTAGGQVVVKQLDRIDITALRTLTPDKFATPASR